MLFGSRLNRLATSIRQGISKYAVGSDNPGLVFDFIDNFYQKDKNQTVNFDGAITHARSSNATMTDGYGPELVTNGGFDSDSDWTLGTGWSIQNNRAYHASGANSNITQSIAVEAGKAYILEFDILEGSADFLWFAVDGVFTAVDNPQVRGGRSFVFTHDTTETIAVGVRAGSSNVATIDNVSVREMPVIKWAPHNLLQYSEQFDLWAGQTNVSVTPNAETSPDGTQTADALVYSATNGIIQRTVQNLVVGASYTFSVWLKADSNVTARIGGFVSGFTDAVTVNVTTEWQQFYVEASVVQTSRYPQIRSDGADTIYVWGAHVYRSDLGGMVDNPDRGDSYVPTAAVAGGDSIVVDGGFDDATNWTLGTGWSISGSKLVGSNVGGTAYAQQTLNTTSGAYVVTFDVTDYTSGNLDVFLGGVTSAVVSITGAGSYSVVITGVGTFTNTTLRLSAGNANFTGSVDNLVVKKSLVDPSAARYLPRIGHHVYNGSAWVNEGVLAESESRVNLDVDSNTFTEAGNATVTADQAVSPSGETDAWLYDENVANNNNTCVFGVHTTVAGTTYTSSVYVKYKAGSGIVGLIHRSNDFNNQFFSWFDIQNGEALTLESGSGTMTSLTSTIEDVGNGWYRISSVGTDTAQSQYNPFLTLVTADNSKTRETDAQCYVWQSQFEAGSTPSSLIPTSGQQGTREAETFTIPSANLPWPTPQSITGNVYSGTDPVNITGAHTFTPTIASDSSTKVVRVKWTQTLNSGTRTRMRFRNAANSLDLRFKYYNGSGTFEEIIVTSTGLLWLQIENAVDVDISGITLEEINPLSVSIGMEGRMTYADTGVTSEVQFLRWEASSNDYVITRLETSTSRTGQVDFIQRESGTTDVVESNISVYSPDILVPYNIASRHGSTFVNGATDGVALTADTTPTALPDLSSTDLDLAYDYMGTISEFRVWDKDIGDAGLVEATNPSLEPSLSLTFEGVGTNSFVTNDWSQ